VVQDLAGNDLATFSNVFADTFITAATTTLASQYRNLTLTGTSAVNGTGNALNNRITGNGAINIPVPKFKTPAPQALMNSALLLRQLIRP